MENLINFKYIMAGIVYSALGMLILAIGFKVFDMMTPGNLWKEIVEEKNVSLAIVTAAMTLAIAHIVASAIHG